MYGLTHKDTEQDIYCHESANHAAGAAVYLPATGFRVDGAEELVVRVPLGVLGASATVQVTLQHADWDGTNDPPEAGDFADANDDAGSAIQFASAIAVAGDSLLYKIVADCKRLKPWVRIGLTVGGSGNAQVAVIATLRGVKYSELAEGSLPATQVGNEAALDVNKSNGVTVQVPTFTA